MPDVTDPLVLPEDIVFSPVEEFSEEIRHRIGSGVRDIAVSRPRSRTTSKVVSADAAALLQLFKQPKTIAEAVVEYCRERSADPSNVLSDSFPLLTEFVNDQFLLPEGSSARESIEARLGPGDYVGEFRIVCRMQTLVDTEIYQARASDGRVAAIKMTRSQAGPAAVAMLAHEARIVQALRGEFSPELLDIDIFEERLAYMSLSWCAGTSVGAVAAQLRAAERDSFLKLLNLCATVLETYGKLHGKGILHGDIHPGNILVDAEGCIWLIDFGLARVLEDEEPSITRPRGGVAFFLEPEYCEAVRRLSAPPPPTPASEQYSLAALIYHMITGAYTHDFSLERETMLRQIMEEQPLEFVKQGVTAMPEVEALLRKALNKRPQERFAGVDELAQRLRKANCGKANMAVVRGPTSHAESSAKFLERVIERCGWEGELLESGLPRAPKASVSYGAGGVGWLFYRLGRMRDDARMLALADLWVDHAREKINHEEAFFNSEIDITEKTVGRISPYHTESGVHAMNVLIADARGDPFTREAALRAYIEAAKGESENLDVTLGYSGLALIGALLARTLDDPKLMEETGLLELGRHTLKRVWATLDQDVPVIERSEIENLGAAHGWAGFLYAALLWSWSTGDPVESGIERRLHELASQAELIGRGARWPWRLGRNGRSYMPGWCNGTAGYVFLWTLAHRMTSDRCWLVLSEKAAWNCWEDPAQPASLCCGLTGRAYALLNFYKLSGDKVWIERARHLAENAARSMPEELSQTDGQGFENSLYKGEVGLATLLADLEQPECAAMPFFETEN